MVSLDLHRLHFSTMAAKGESLHQDIASYNIVYSDKDIDPYKYSEGKWLRNDLAQQKCDTFPLTLMLSAGELLSSVAA